MQYRKRKCTVSICICALFLPASKIIFYAYYAFYITRLITYFFSHIKNKYCIFIHRKITILDRSFRQSSVNVTSRLSLYFEKNVTFECTNKEP